MSSYRNVKDGPVTYRIQVAGQIQESRSSWFNEMQISTSKDADGIPVTTLVGSLVDQAALHGVLSKLHNLNLAIISVGLVETGDERADDELGSRRSRSSSR